MNIITIRLESPTDYSTVEDITREAFWNLYVPGCDEHYFAHILRSHFDFISELDFVAMVDGKIVGNIMYTHSYILGHDGKKHSTITFGPLSVLPAYQNKGVGSALVNHSLNRGKELGFSAVLIYGNPAYYNRFGFRPGKDFGISGGEGKFPSAHQALELKPGAIENAKGTAHESPVFNINPEDAAAFDLSFPPKEKLETESQKEFLKMVTTFL